MGLRGFVGDLKRGEGDTASRFGGGDLWGGIER